MRSGRWILALCLVFGLQTACASVYQTDALVDGQSLRASTLEQVVGEISRGSIVIVSERHDLKTHHDKQVMFMNELLKQGHRVSAGFEFFDYLQQPLLNEYNSGKISESDFLKQANWGASDFGFYREQMRIGASSGGAFALNAPRAVTSQIAKVGLEGLTANQAAYLPPNLTRGRSSYFERFSETMQGHVPSEQIERYFQAQSTWDETMAWQAVNYSSLYPQDTMVIIVGDFHAQYGGGLPDRLRERLAAANLARPVVVVSQVQLDPTMPPEEERAEVEPHPKWGARAEFIWISRGN